MKITKYLDLQMSELLQTAEMYLRQYLKVCRYEWIYFKLKRQSI